MSIERLFSTLCSYTDQISIPINIPSGKRYITIFCIEYRRVFWHEDVHCKRGISSFVIVHRRTTICSELVASIAALFDRRLPSRVKTHGSWAKFRLFIKSPLQYIRLLQPSLYFRNLLQVHRCEVAPICLVKIGRCVPPKPERTYHPIIDCRQRIGTGDVCPDAPDNVLVGDVGELIGG